MDENTTKLPSGMYLSCLCGIHKSDSKCEVYQRNNNTLTMETSPDWKEDFIEKFDHRFLQIARMADDGNDRGYGHALAILQIDIEKYVEGQRLLAQKALAEAILARTNNGNSYVDADDIREEMRKAGLEI